jgi:signal transduction histidine kinase
MTPSATLATLADDLAADRDAILAAWSAAARHDPDLTTPTTLSRSQFFDHIPAMLDALERKLRSTALRETLEARQDEIENAESHGLQRWQQGYRESEVMREWISLNACLADALTAFAARHPDASPAAMSSAWRMVSEFTIAGMSESVAQYTRLQRTEASGRVRALEEALTRLNELERERAALWREAAHDLRGNLGVVKNVAQVLQQTLPGGVPADPLRMLERGVSALHALLDDLTVQARLDAGEERREVMPFDAAALLEELCAAVEITAGNRGLFLRTDGPAALEVEGDAVKVRRIAQNLLHNAVSYTEQGGVEVSWQAVEEPPRRWTLCVRDTGPGLASAAVAPLSVAIAAATRDTLASEADARAHGDASADAIAAPTLPSQSSADGAHGEGVGLSIVKRLCELLDASMELSTAPGKGTTFRVTFPTRYPKG